MVSCSSYQHPSCKAGAKWVTFFQTWSNKCNSVSHYTFLVASTLSQVTFSSWQAMNKAGLRRPSQLLRVFRLSRSPREVPKRWRAFNWIHIALHSKSLHLCETGIAPDFLSGRACDIQIRHQKISSVILNGAGTDTGYQMVFCCVFLLHRGMQQNQNWKPFPERSKKSGKLKQKWKD